MARRSKQRSSDFARRFTDLAFARGADGSGAWLGIGILATSGHIVRRLARRRRRVVARTRLAPGSEVRIHHLLEDRAGRTVEVRRRGRVRRTRR
jgi:hypothetical protein